MRQKIRVTDKKTGKVTESEREIRNLEHFNIQLNNRAHVFKSKKGKGSYTRKQKHKNENGGI